MVNDETIFKVAELLVRLPDETLVRKNCLETLAVPLAEIDAVLVAARVRLTQAADYHRVEEIGAQIIKLKKLYKLALANEEPKTALAVLKEENRLKGLYPDAGAAVDPSPATAEQDETLALVRDHLEPLRLAGPNTPTDELARLAASKLLELADPNTMPGWYTD